jgi:tetratricopeptide (TPR) repeat protein
VAAAVWLFGDNPDRLFQEAREIAGKDPAQADRLLERCLDARLDFPEAQLLRCRVLGSLGQWDEAYGLFSLIKRPQELPGPELLEFARQARSAGQLSLCHDVAESARRPGPSLIPATQLLLAVCIQQRQEDRAFDLARELTSLIPDEPLPWQVMAVYLQDRERSSEAVVAYRAALQRQTNTREQEKLRITLGELLIEAGDIAGTREVIAPLLKVAQPETDALLLEVAALRFEGRSEDAFQIVARILKTNPKLSQALYLRGLLYFDNGQFEAARDDLVQVTRLDPNHKEAHYKLSQTWQRLGDAARAAEELAISRKLTEAARELGRLKYQISRGAKDDATLERYRELTRSSEPP